MTLYGVITQEVARQQRKTNLAQITSTKLAIKGSVFLRSNLSCLNTEVEHFEKKKVTFASMEN